MAYELGDAIKAGNVTTTYVQARQHTFTEGGSISPDGTKVLVASTRRNNQANIDRGIDIWHSGSSGWSEVDSIDSTSGAVVNQIHWFSDSEILFLESNFLRSYTSSSSGWSENYSTNLGAGFTPAHMWISPGKTVIGLGEAFNARNASNMRQNTPAKLVHTSSAGFTDIVTLDESTPGGTFFKAGRITAMTWPDEENVLIGQARRNFDAGCVTHFRSGSSGYTAKRQTFGNAGSTQNFGQFGSFLYWHSASNSGIYGATRTTSPNNLVLHLIPSQSSGYLPAQNPHLTTVGGTVIDTSDLEANANTTMVMPTMALGSSINVDRASPDRLLVTTIRQNDTNRFDGRVYFVMESGSSGWKVEQLNPNGDGVSRSSVNALNPSQMACNASRIVTFREGNFNQPSAANPSFGFTIHETGLPNDCPTAGPPPGFTLSPAAGSQISINEGATSTVTVKLDKKPSGNVVVDIALHNDFAGRASLSTTSLTFNDTDFDTPKQVIITAIDDEIDSVPDSVTEKVTFSINAAASADEFDTVASKEITLTVVDQDTAGITVTPSADPLQINEDGSGTIAVKLTKKPASGNVVIDITAAASLSGRATLDKNTLTFDDTNWNVNQTVQISGVPDDILRNNSVGNVTFAVNNELTAHTKFHDLTDTVTVTVLDDETASIVLTRSANPFEIDEGATGTITAVLGKEPAGTVKVDIALPAQFSGRATADKTSFTFDNTNWNNPAAHTVTITATPDDIDNDPITNNITFSVNDGATTLDKFKDLPDQTVATTIKDDDDAAFELTPSVSPFKITESKTGKISVVLKAEPRTGTVKINVQLENSLSSRASLSATSFTFTKTNWDQVQELTVTATDNNSVDGTATGKITFSIDNSSSVEFRSLASQEVDTIIEDNDSAGLTFAPGTFLSTTEQGASAVLSIKLTAQPTADVVITSTQPDDTEGTMDPNPVSLIFTSDNWNVFQTITFTGKQDLELDGNQRYFVTVSSTSTDSDFNNLSQVITILNVDSGVVAPSGGGPSGGFTPTPDEEEDEEEEERGSSDEVSFPAGTAQRRRGKSQRTQADLLPRKMHFEPSTIETIDKSVLNYMEGLDLFSNSNEGWKKVPIIWASAERAYQVKKDKALRDAQGMLRLPIISIKRNSLVKDMGSKGVFQGNVPEIDKFSGGSLAVGRVIYQDKTNKFASADALRLHKQSNFPRPNPKVVYRTVIAPMPVNVTVMYDITIRTEYQQQMNDLILPFVTTPGTINFVSLVEGEHRFEGFIQGDFQNNDNLSDFSSDERKFEVKIPLKVIAYLVGQEDNRDKPHYSVRENAVEVKIPRERISLNEIPSHENGSYYGLSGIAEPVFISGFHAPFLFSNVPAVGSGGTGAGTNSGEGPVSSNIVTKTNFSDILQENLVIREILKRSTDAVPSPANQLTITTATIKENTESLYLNGAILAPGTLNDYTISGQVITLNFNLDATDVVFVTYIKQ